MGFYDDRVLPRLLNVFMNTKAIREQRTQTLERVRGEVLEIGFGSGLNLPHYAGFTVERVENSYLKGAPKFGGYLYRGVAKRPD